MSTPKEFSSSQILEQLNRILLSPQLQNSPTLSQFLKYVVEETIGGRAQDLIEYSIARAVLSRKPDFNPQFDAIVRVHAGRLRRALHEYYLTIGQHDDIIISMPKGSYAISFEENPDTSKSEARLSENDPTSSQKIVVAVLPFRNIGNDADDFFAEGLGEQLSVELARYDIHSVVAYYSSRYVAAQTSNLKEAGKMLGARYILTGSIQRNKNNLNIYAQLIDSETSEQLWVNSYEKKNIGKDLFEIQDEIVHHVVNKTAGYYGAIFRNTAKLAAGKTIEDIKIYDAVFFYYHFKNKFTHEAFQKARRALNYAVKADADYALAWALLGEIYGDSYIMQFHAVDDPLQRGMENVRRAIRLDPLCQHAYQALTWISTILHNKPEAIKAIEDCIAINPNAMFTVGSMGFALICLGEFERGIKLMEESKQLNPFSPWWFNAGFSFYYFHKKEYEQALHWAEKMYMPQVPWDAILKIACLAKMERIQECEIYLDRLNLSAPAITNLREYLCMFLSSDELVDELHDAVVEAGFYKTKNPA